MPQGASDFIDEINKNPELRKKLFQQSAEVVLDLAKQHGFTFTSQELHDALRERLGVPTAPAAETGAEFCVVVVVAAAGKNR